MIRAVDCRAFSELEWTIHVSGPRHNATQARRSLQAHLNAKHAIKCRVRANDIVVGDDDETAISLEEAVVRALPAQGIAAISLDEAAARALCLDQLNFQGSTPIDIYIMYL
jgi:hypothetical protein